MAGAVGIEPTTHGLTVRHCCRLSYAPILFTIIQRMKSYVKYLKCDVDHRFQLSHSKYFRNTLGTSRIKLDTSINDDMLSITPNSQSVFKISCMICIIYIAKIICTCTRYRCCYITVKHFSNHNIMKFPRHFNIPYIPIPSCPQENGDWLTLFKRETSIRQRC